MARNEDMLIDYYIIAMLFHDEPLKILESGYSFFLSLYGCTALWTLGALSVS
jgi:hypothetical protein